MMRPIKALIRKCVADVMQNAIDEVIREQQRVQENNKALDYLDRLLRPLEPWSGWAMHPSAILTVVNDILLNERSMVVECGAGLSTLYAAKALAMQGGRLISFEGELPWAERIRGQIQELGLASSVEVIHAELSEWRSRDGHLHVWYDEKVVWERLEAASPVDLLVVDGPPESVCHHARYPAVPVIRPYLNERYAIILHDIHRPQEQEIVDLWRQEVSARFINDYRARGVSYGRSGSYYEA